MTDLKKSFLNSEQLKILRDQDWPEHSKVIGYSAGIEGTTWFLELIDAGDFNRVKKSLKTLVKTSETPNPFFEAAFLEPAITNLGMDQIGLLCLSEITGDHRELKFFAPAAIEHTGWRRTKVLRIWSHPFAPISTPLMCKKEFAHTLHELMNCIEAASDQYGQAIMFEQLPKHSKFSKNLFEQPRFSDRLLRFAASNRAGVDGLNAMQCAVTQITGKRKQRLRRAQERLQSFGKLTFENVSRHRMILQSLEEHLSLEDTGWKSRKGTSILKNNATAIMVRSLVSNLSTDGKCEIHALRLNDTMIASMILIHTQGHYFPWKIAYDESYAKYSAGNVLLAHVNEILSKKSDFKLLDSLASDLNDTAKRFWPDQMEVSSMVIGLGPDATRNALKVSSDLELVTKLKKSLKKKLGRSL
ncbi:MAG: GNAT family N-acetyltransferase [Pseudomonadota bacterium]